MKSKIVRPFLPLSSLFLSVLLSTSARAEPESIEGATRPDLLRIRKHPTSLELTFTDPTNSVWTLQRSPDLSTWEEFRDLRITNSTWITHVPTTSDERSLFVRAIRKDSAPPLSQQHLNLGTFAYEVLAEPPAPLLGSHSQTTASDVPELFENPSEGAALGRLLFYDKRLSANNTVSCSSCHQQKHAFADPRRVSIGFNGVAGTRNAPSLVNTTLQSSFFWDSRAQNLEDAVLQPIEHVDEMGSTFDQLANKLGAEPLYQEFFAARFGSPEVTSQRISIALSQFLRSILSYRSKYDYTLNPNSPPPLFDVLTAQEKRGHNLFEQHCSSCHQEQTFQRKEPRNIGLDLLPHDQGVGAVTQDQKDMGLFKVPTLRNVALTAPYMHDGRFKTLQEVVDHYSERVVNHTNRWGGLPVGGVNLAASEKEALVSFLHLLTDRHLIKDERLSDPFEYSDPIPVAE